MEIFVITGQTATGKTKTALKIAKKNRGELINCDSRQIYKYLNIVTGKDIDKNWQFVNFRRIDNFDIGYFQKITKEITKKNINNLKNQSTNYSKIWLYDIVKPNQYFSSYDYVRCANYVVKYLINKKITPVIVGGTYFYLKHLLYGIETENIPPNWNLRKTLIKKNIKELQKILFAIDSLSFNKLNNSDLNNPHRLIRKIEIASTTKNQSSSKSLSWSWGLFFKNRHSIKIYGLRFKNKADLILSIKKRIEQRLANGALNEAKKLLKMGFRPSDFGLKTIGYQELFAYLDKKISLKKAINQWLKTEVQYAKRQYTFMKKDKNIVWEEI